MKFKISAETPCIKGLQHLFYFNNCQRREFITIHQLSSKKLNYISEHYAAIARKSHIFKDEHIMDRAKENLEIIGKVYDYE